MKHTKTSPNASRFGPSQEKLQKKPTVKVELKLNCWNVYAQMWYALQNRLVYAHLFDITHHE